MKKLLIGVTIVMLLVMIMLSACGAAPPTKAPPATTHASVYTQPAASTPGMDVRPPAMTPTATRPATGVPATQPAPVITVATPTSGGTLALSAGGAKDIANFRENIRNRYLPLPTDVTYEGLFYDYYFDMGPSEPSPRLFSPSYSYAVTRDPLSRQPEYYLSVGLNSGMKESDFARKNLNLVIVLDNSGSMGEYFNEYYYDGYGSQKYAYEGSGVHRPRKMDSAKEAVLSILDQLENDDRFAIVLFNSKASLLKSMGPVNEADITRIKNQVLDVNAGGSTNLTAGMDIARDQFRSLRDLNSYEYENRIIILTDAQPNTGDISFSGMMGRVQDNAANRIYSTFIGIGVDFNSGLVEQITKTRGANYYSVHSPKEFKQRIDEEFDFMVTPLVFDLQLMFESAGWRIEKVFGSPEANEATGELMKINTMFPAPRSDGGEARGGLVLLKLRKTSGSVNEPVYLKASYEDRNGRADEGTAVITLESTAPEYFDNSGIRKGILLTRYAALLQNWLADERQHLNHGGYWDPCIREDTGIVIPINLYYGQWERQSAPLKVSEPYRSIFRTFSQYFEQEAAALQDSSLDQETEILRTLMR